MDNLVERLSDIVDSAIFLLSDVKPSEWNERNRIMTSEVSAFPGPYSYDKTPYCREIVDCFHRSHPAKEIAVMKGGQVGFTVGVIEAAIGYIISEDPGNVLYLTGHADLAEEAVTRLDQMIDGSKLRHLIRSNITRARNQRTGDTNKGKEFPGGSLISGSAGNHKLLRQRSIQYAFVDDYEAAKKSSKESGNTGSLIRQRLAAFFGKMKIAWISTPENKETSNIEPAYLKGDQRRYHIPCPCCGEFIFLEWEIKVEGKENEMAGITWKLDDKNKLILDSVGYICQKCGGFFDDKNKAELLSLGHWKATAESSSPDYFSYHLSCLYAPPGMYDWKYYVRQYLEACPPEGDVKEDELKAFKNLCLGLTHETKGEAPKANDLQKHQRNYQIGIIPDQLSQQDGNGRIVMVTCACDMNGNEDDARLDWEIVAWAESGASYSVKHGSIGTFIPREGSKAKVTDREKLSYQSNKSNNVWKELTKVITAFYETDNKKRMQVFLTAIDCGYHTKHAYNFIDTTNCNVIGLKGKDEDKYVRFGVDVPHFKKSRERPDSLYIVEVGLVKDDIAAAMSLKWDPDKDETQPHGFMNYPLAVGKLYDFKNYFEHYESEERKVEQEPGKEISFRWAKKSANVQNHFWDVRVYNRVLRDIVAYMICTSCGLKNTSWKMYVDVMTGKYKS